MKKFNYTIICIVFLSVMNSVSCKKQLTENIHSNLTSSNFYKTASDVEAGLNGVFLQMILQTYYQRTVYLISDLSCDIFRPFNTNADRQEFYKGTYSSSNNELYAWWTNCYTLIKNANDFLTNVPAVDINATDKNNYLGNAYFLRALAYFELTTIYGDVPLVLKNDAGQNLFPSRTATSAVYDQVISDLLFAEANCYHANQLATSKIGRVTSEAASALLARVYLQRASTTFAAGTDNQNALSECNKLIAYANANPNYLGLLPNYKDLFDVTKKNSVESIFAVQFTGTNTNYLNITNLMFNPGSVNGGFGSFVALDAFYNSYDPIDLRRTVNVGYNVNGTYYISKYNDPTVAAGAYGTQNWMVLRYGDVLLMQSEAMNNLNPSDPNKFNGINTIRTRAGLGSKLLNLTNTPTSDSFITALSNERLWELPIEGHRRIDLIRFKKFLAVKQSQGFAIGNNQLVMPIPQPELSVNKNLVQNPGY